LICSKFYLPGLEHFQIKYWVVGFEERNNFSHCDFPRFESNFELKFREAIKVLKASGIYLKYLGVLENYETWSIILPLHLVEIKIISRWFEYKVLKSL
jgi:hypothetical protein